MDISMKTSIIKLLKDKNELIKQIESANASLTDYEYRFSELAYIKGTPQKGITLDEIFVTFLAQWVKIQKSEFFSNFEENKSKPIEQFLDKLFHTTNFSELIVENIEDKTIRNRITDAIVTDHYDEKKRIIDMRGLQNAKLVKIGRGDDKSLFFGKTRRFCFMISERCLIEWEQYGVIANNIHQILFNNDLSNAIRKRPGMYIGSMSGNGLHRMIFNLIEEILEDATKKEIQVEILSIDTVKIICDSYEIANNSYSFARVQWVIVNNLSEFFTWQDSLQYFETEKGILTLEESRKSELRGIRVIFKPDKEIFDDITLDYYRFLKRFMELASLNPYKIILLDKDNKNVIQIPNGINALMEIDDFSRHEIIRLNFSVPEVQAEIALSFSWFDIEIQKSYVNNHQTFEGGTHVEGMLKGVRCAIEKFVNKYAKDPKHYEYTNLLMKELKYVIRVKIDHPRWYGSTKRKLKNLEIKKMIEKNVAEQLYDKFEENQEFIKSSSGYSWNWLDNWLNK